MFKRTCRESLEASVVLRYQHISADIGIVLLEWGWVHLGFVLDEDNFFSGDADVM